VKLWLDDLRKPPNDTWVWVTLASEAVAHLKTGSVKVASLDHDLGGAAYVGPGADGKDGMAVIDFMEENNIWPPLVILHSLNTPKRALMAMVAGRYTRALDAPFGSLQYSLIKECL